MTSASPTAPLGRAGLYLLLAGQLLPMIDFSIVNVALDAMAHSLHASEVDLELIVAVYGVAFAVCLAMGGRLGDNYGRRRLFSWGILLFTVASALCGLAHSVWLLLAARALQGVAAALAVPQILATIHVTLRDREHSRALSLYGAIGGLAFVIGQVLGGILVSADVGGLGWRLVFLINLPIGLVVLAYTRRMIPETRSPHPASVDRPGTLLLALVILCLLLPLSLGPLQHWPWYYVAMLAAVPVLLAALWRTELGLEKRGRLPLLPPNLLRLSSIRFGLSIAVLFFACWSGFMFAMALTLQAGAGLTAMQCGNCFVAMGLAYFVGSILTNRAAARFRKTSILLFGCVVTMTGLLGLVLTLWHVWPEPGLFNLIPATVLIGFGQAFIVASFFRIGLSEVRPEQAGAGSATLSTVQQAALGLGPALSGAVLTHFLGRTGRDYQHAIIAVLLAEVCVISVLAVSTARYARREQAGRGRAAQRASSISTRPR
ncbi:membrane efflux protein [Bordetella ansorpii]|uniref:Membrane efflux protein n=1 Tax=Bordetella ansorpii TaxID=288768 RepID=A0A157SGU5_9BORD|nr:MFS transporter [Bordetella ansorpii]SAI69431.1 membrane efflux protein [Bordetella ansorpii]